MTYRILDLFCGAGGAAVGYNRAGFEVVGVDISPQPHYPFEFIQWDALDILDKLFTGAMTVAGGYITTGSAAYLLDDFDAIHASPPCQAYSIMSNVHQDAELKYPKLIGPVRKLLMQTGLPYVIENVPGSSLRNYTTLCGSHFGLQVFHNGRTYELRRHRLFETNWPLTAPRTCDHSLPSLPVYGHSRPSHRPDLAGPGFAKAAREVMGIDWMNRPELSESIPPAYTEYVGTHLRMHLDSTSKGFYPQEYSMADPEGA